MTNPEGGFGGFEPEAYEQPATPQEISAILERSEELLALHGIKEVSHESIRSCDKGNLTLYASTANLNDTDRCCSTLMITVPEQEGDEGVRAYFNFSDASNNPLIIIEPEDAEEARDVCITLMESGQLNHLEEHLVLLCIRQIAERLGGPRLSLDNSNFAAPEQRDRWMKSIKTAIQKRTDEYVETLTYEYEDRENEIVFGVAYFYPSSSQAASNLYNYEITFQQSIDPKVVLKCMPDGSFTFTEESTDGEEIIEPTLYHVAALNNAITDSIEKENRLTGTHIGIYPLGDRVDKNRPFDNEGVMNIRRLAASTNFAYLFYKSMPPGSQESEAAFQTYDQQICDLLAEFESRFHLVDHNRTGLRHSMVIPGLNFENAQSMTKMRNMLAIDADVVFFQKEDGWHPETHEPGRLVVMEYVSLLPMKIDKKEASKSIDDVFVVGVIHAGEGRRYMAAIPLSTAIIESSAMLNN